jgi:ribosomal protein S25
MRKTIWLASMLAIAGGLTFSSCSQKTKDETKEATESMKDDAKDAADESEQVMKEAADDVRNRRQCRL